MQDSSYICPNDGQRRLVVRDRERRRRNTRQGVGRRQRGGIDGVEEEQGELGVQGKEKVGGEMGCTETEGAAGRQQGREAYR